MKIVCRVQLSVLEWRFVGIVGSFIGRTGETGTAMSGVRNAGLFRIFVCHGFQDIHKEYGLRPLPYGGRPVARTLGA